MRRLFPTTTRDQDMPVSSARSASETSSGIRRRTQLIRAVTSILIVGLIVAFLAGVATNHLPSLSGERRAATPVRGGSIVDGIPFDPDSLLPLRTGHAGGTQVDQAIWAPLWYGDPQGSFHAGLAKDVPSASNGDISPDLTTWTIHLRSGLKWSDGTPLTAQDCAFSFNLYADPAYTHPDGSPTGFPTTDPADPIGFVSATALDETTVVLKLKHPDVVMKAVLADGTGTCLPRKIFAGMTAADVDQSSQNFWPTVTSGPFTVKERVGNDHVTLVRNPYYYQGPDKPYLDRITTKDYNGTDPLTPLLTHTLDIEGERVDYASLADYQAIPGYTTYLDRYPAGYEVLVFKMTDPLMSDHAIRQAFTMGFDTHEVLALLNGTAKLTCDDSAGTFAHEPSLVPCYHYDPAAASQLLDADGWTMGTDGVRHKIVDGKDTPLELAFGTTSRPVRHQTALLIKRELGGIGMKLDVTEYAVPDYFGSGSDSVLAGGHFQIAEFGSGDGYDPDDHSFLASDQTPEQGGGNVMRYANLDIDAQERVQQSTADEGARKATFHIIHEDVLKDLPVMYLYTQQNIACARSDLHNVDPSALGGVEMWNVWDWWLGSNGR